MAITLPTAYQNAATRTADVTQQMLDLYNVVQQINAQTGSTSWSSLTAPTTSNSVTATVDTSQTLLGHFDTNATNQQTLFTLGEDVASTKSAGFANRSRMLAISTLAGSLANPFWVITQGVSNFFLNSIGALSFVGLSDAVTTSGGSGAILTGGASASANAAGGIALNGGANSSTGAGGNVSINPGSSTSGQAGLFVSVGLEANLSKTVNSTNALTTLTVSTRYVYLTGTAGASMAVTFPAGTAAIDGELITIMSTASRASTTWTSSGATFTGAPSTMAANTPYKFQYDNSTTSWYITA